MKTPSQISVWPRDWAFCRLWRASAPGLASCRPWRGTSRRIHFFLPLAVPFAGIFSSLLLHILPILPGACFRLWTWPYLPQVNWVCQMHMGVWGPATKRPLLAFDIPIWRPVPHIAPIHLALPSDINSHFWLWDKCLLQAFSFPFHQFLPVARTVNVVEFTFPHSNPPPFEGEASYRLCAAGKQHHQHKQSLFQALTQTSHCLGKRKPNLTKKTKKRL